MTSELGGSISRENLSKSNQISFTLSGVDINHSQHRRSPLLTTPFKHEVHNLFPCSHQVDKLAAFRTKPKNPPPKTQQQQIHVI